MKKLKLNLDDLKIESFETNNKKFPKGTAIGQGTLYPSCVPTQCTYETVDLESCNGFTCDNTCGCPPNTKFPCD